MGRQGTRDQGCWVATWATAPPPPKRVACGSGRTSRDAAIEYERTATSSSFRSSSLWCSVGHSCSVTPAPHAPLEIDQFAASPSVQRSSFWPVCSNLLSKIRIIIWTCFCCTTAKCHYSLPPAELVTWAAITCRCNQSNNPRCTATTIVPQKQ
jgi:hypothetical protein